VIRLNTTAGRGNQHHLVLSGGAAEVAAAVNRWPAADKTLVTRVDRMYLRSASVGRWRCSASTS
jgi:hypothetical protein